MARRGSTRRATDTACGRVWLGVGTAVPARVFAPQRGLALDFQVVSHILVHGVVRDFFTAPSAERVARPHTVRAARLSFESVGEAVGIALSG